MTIITYMYIILLIVLVMWWPLSVECSCLIRTFYLCFRHGMYSVVTCPVLCNVTLWMQINTNTNTKNLQRIKKHVC